MIKWLGRDTSNTVDKWVFFIYRGLLSRVSFKIFFSSFRVSLSPFHNMLLTIFLFSVTV